MPHATPTHPHHPRGDLDHDPDHGHAHARGQHSQAHAHALPGHNHQAALRWALVATALFMVVEAVVGLTSGSLALVADAGHMLSDSGALALALAAQVLANRAASHEATYGYRRAEVLAAFVNGIVLALISLLIAKEAIERFMTPTPMQTTPVMICAALGLLVNLAVANRLHASGGGNLNVRAALLHVMADAVGSVGVLVSAVLVKLLEWKQADAVVSGLIAILIAFGGFRILQRTAGVLLESVPAEVDVQRLRECIKSTPGVADFHDLHVWRISEGFDVVSVHVTLAPQSHGVEVCQAVRERIQRDVGIEHVTVQPEAAPPNELVALRHGRDGRIVSGGR
jgi:cobalt-zinc-cadmium efflux system protein